MAEDSKAGSDGKNPFILNLIFPDAEQVFAFKLKALENIRDDCDIVLDTNVLLIPYTTSPKSIEQINLTYKTLVDQKRLIIPGQVAREFAKNRASKISEIYQQLSNKRDSIPPLKKSAYPLLEPLEQFRKQLELEDTINKLLSDYRGSINDLLNLISDWTWNDPVSELYRELFSSNVVKDFPIEEEELRAEMENRKLHKIPPGYKDRGAGDLIIWKNILEHGRESKRNIIFVSNDVKTDWWYQSDRDSLYPRYELVDEFRQQTDGCSLHIITFSKFLDLYGASETVVEEVRIEEKLARIDTVKTHTKKQDVFKAVWKWLVSNYPDSAILRYTDFPDFVISRPDSTKIGVIVKTFGQSFNVTRRLREITELIKADPNQFFSNYLIVCVGLNISVGMLVFDRLHKLKPALPNATVFVGYINETGDFESLY